MARTCDVTPSYLYVDTAVITATPLSLACWFNSSSTAAYQMLVCLANNANRDLWALVARGNAGGDPIQAMTYNGVTVKVAGTIPGYTANTWYHACATFGASDTGRAAYLNGGSKGTEASTLAIDTPDNTTIGGYRSSDPSDNPLLGSVAEAAIWNVELTDAEVAILAARYSPLFVRPQNLVGYWPLIRNQDYDLFGGVGMNTTGTPGIGTHPAIIYPGAVPFDFLRGQARGEDLSGVITASLLRSRTRRMGSWCVKA